MQIFCFFLVKFRIGGLLYLGGLRFLKFLAAVFRFFTNIGAVFRFCRLLRFAEMDLFLIRFSALSYICSGFSVFEKCAVSGYLLHYCGSWFTVIPLLIKACANGMQQTINEARANEQCTVDIFLYLWSISFKIRLLGRFIGWEQLPIFLPFVHSK